MRLLIIEDEKPLTKSIHSYLLQSNYLCDAAYNFSEGRSMLESSAYDCIVLDINLPGGSGLELLQHMKKRKVDAGVIIISARNSLDDKINALQLGGDDYLTKPFHLAELTARINSIIRRKNFDGNNIVIFDKLTVHLLDKTVKTGNAEIHLTKKEFKLLLYFISNKNRIVTKEAIADHLWEDYAMLGYSYDFIYSHIKNLRKKLIEKGCPDYIKALYGMGYKFIAEENHVA
ncbi:response regulator transcription factor [Chitinophaga qingshengii]|uniref:Response regulator transcription factor n=1 Tax=Chitinophaga qingshengii TaxID=1569794 RepID=A0ABR7TUK2_9BACT|nr:response regulator transcription factor [Chitinophaga qingshengii]MBC9934161.1 response regulator transcription factor [Chitinophaga qingshengii]